HGRHQLRRFRAGRPGGPGGDRRPRRAHRSDHQRVPHPGHHRHPGGQLRVGGCGPVRPAHARWRRRAGVPGAGARLGERLVASAALPARPAPAGVGAAAPVPCRDRHLRARQQQGRRLPLRGRPAAHQGDRLRRQRAAVRPGRDRHHRVHRRRQLAVDHRHERHPQLGGRDRARRRRAQRRGRRADRAGVRGLVAVPDPQHHARPRRRPVLRRGRQGCGGGAGGPDRRAVATQEEALPMTDVKGGGIGDEGAAPEASFVARVAAGDRSLLALIGVLVALVLANGLIDQSFLSLSQLRNTLLVTAPLALLAGGQTLCMLTGGIDLSVAMTATAAAYVTGVQSPEGPVTAILAGLLVGVAVGLVNGLAIGVFRVNPLIMTLGMSGILTGLLTVGSQTFLGGATRMSDLVLELGGGTIIGPIPWNLVVWLLLGGALVVGLRRTGLGRMIYAIGDNRVACRLAGVRVWQVETAVYTLCALLAAVAGILIGGRSGSVDLQLAGSYLLPSVAAAVIGGTSILGGIGGYTGTILGALILVVLDTMLNLLSVDEALKQVLYGCIILV